MSAARVRTLPSRRKNLFSQKKKACFHVRVGGRWRGHGASARRQITLGSSIILTLRVDWDDYCTATTPTVAKIDEKIYRANIPPYSRTYPTQTVLWRWPYFPEWCHTACLFAPPPTKSTPTPVTLPPNIYQLLRRLLQATDSRLAHRQEHFLI